MRTQRFDPETSSSPLTTAEHTARYRMAGTFVAGLRVLDAGCGTGYGAALLADAGASEVVGIDISPEAVEDASKRYGSDLVRFETGNLLALDEIGQFDLIVCFEVLEHLIDPAGVLGALRSRLTPRGVLVCSVPNAAAGTADMPSPLVGFDLDRFTALLHSEFAWATVAVQHRGVLAVVNTLVGGGTAEVDLPSVPDEPAVAFIGVAAAHAVSLPPAVAVSASSDDLQRWVSEAATRTADLASLEHGYHDLEVSLKDALAAAGDRLEELGRVHRDLAVALAERDTHIHRAAELTRELVVSSTLLAENHETMANLRSRLKDVERQKTEEDARRAEEEEARREEMAYLASRHEAAAGEASTLRAELDAVRNTLSWRITRSLRVARRLLPRSR